MLDEKGGVAFSNEAAKKLFKLFGCKDVNERFPLFTFKQEELLKAGNIEISNEMVAETKLLTLKDIISSTQFKHGLLQIDVKADQDT